jgi:hypothetical protein
MTIRTALLPHKHIRFCDSLVALAGHLRSYLHEARTVDELWATMDRDSKKWLGNPSFTSMVLALDVLFAIGQIETVADGRVRLVTP